MSRRLTLLSPPPTAIRPLRCHFVVGEQSIYDSDGKEQKQEQTQDRKKEGRKKEERKNERKEGREKVRET